MTQETQKKSDGESFGQIFSEFRLVYKNHGVGSHFMKPEFRLLVGCISLALLGAYVLEAHGQQPVQFPASGIIIPHNPYNDLTGQVNEASEKVFGSAEGRKACAAELLSAVDRYIPVLQAEMAHPGSQSAPEPDSPLAKMFKQHPEKISQLEPFLAERIRECGIFRLALEEPTAVNANQAALAQGGDAAAQASIDRAAAAWLNAYQDPAAQSAALDALRAAIAAAGHVPSVQLWWMMWDHNQPASEDVGKKMIASLQSYSTTIGGPRLTALVQMKVKRFQLADKPLTLEGSLMSGTYLSTANWKGKVILVDGWSPACPKTFDSISDCRNLLAKYQSQGLEVLGLDYDKQLAAAKKTLAAHPECKFPVMYQVNKPDPVLGCMRLGQYRFGESMLGPTILIDRQGVMHYTDNNPQHIEAEIVKLLAESP
jgi:hypothetical protein